MLAKPITRRGENQQSPHDFLSNQPRSTHPVHRNAVGWRLEAVRQVRLLMGRGYRRFAAQHEIATQLGRTIDEMQEWERDLLRSPDYENDLLCSELAGEFLRAAGGRSLHQHSPVQIVRVIQGRLQFQARRQYCQGPSPEFHDRNPHRAQGIVPPLIAEVAGRSPSVLAGSRTVRFPSGEQAVIVWRNNGCRDHEVTGIDGLVDQLDLRLLGIAARRLAGQPYGHRHFALDPAEGSEQQIGQIDNRVGD